MRARCHTPAPAHPTNIIKHKQKKSEVRRRADAERAAREAVEGELSALSAKLQSQVAELAGAFKASLEGLARTVQDLHGIIK